MGRPRSTPRTFTCREDAREDPVAAQPDVAEIVRRYALQREHRPRIVDYCISSEHYVLHALAEVDSLDAVRWELRVTLGGFDKEATQWTTTELSDRGAVAHALSWLLSVHTALLRPLAMVLDAGVPLDTPIDGLTLEDAVARISGVLRDWSAIFNNWPGKIAELVPEFRLEATRLVRALQRIECILQGLPVEGAPVHQRLNGQWAKPGPVYDEAMSDRL